MADLDLDNLSPEDKAIFDAMVAEEMRKLEEQFQKEANAMVEDKYEDKDEPLPPTSSYVPTARPPPNPTVVDHSSSHFDNYSIERSKEGLPRQQHRRDDNNLNAGRLAYKSPEWSNEDEIHVGKGARAMGIGRHQSKEEKRLKQQEYAAQLNDGMMARKAAISPRDRHSAAAAKRAEGGLSVSRSAGSHRSSEEDARRQKILAQQKYAQELQEQQSARHKADQIPEGRDRKPIQRRAQSPIQPSNILSSPTSVYTSAGGRQRGAPPLTDREKARQKQAEYHRQLEADKQLALLSSPSDRPRVNNSQNNSQRKPSPIARDEGLSERDKKHQRQLEYASQLKLDMEKNTSMENNRVQRSSRSEPTLQKTRNRETDLGINIGGERPHQSRREKQAEYARQIREASEQKAISTPRQALSARRQGNSPQQDPYDRNNGTGLAFGSDVATAAQRAQKRERQSKYREELASGSNSKPITSSRVSLHSNRSRQDEELGVRGGGHAGFSTAGLIGNQESEQEKMRKKRENQKEYFEQLRTGPSPAKAKQLDRDRDRDRDRDNVYGDYSKPVTRERVSTYDRAPSAAQQEEYTPTQEDYSAPINELSQRLAQAYQEYDPYEQQQQQQPPPMSERYGKDTRYRAPPPPDDSDNVLAQMRADSQSRIADDDHYSPTKSSAMNLPSKRSEDGNISFDGINPPYGRYNKGMNVPDADGNLPSARLPQQQHRQRQQQQEYQLQLQQQQNESQYRHEQENNEQQYWQAHQGTSLTIGNMDVQTSEGRDRKAYEQQKYVQDLEREKNRAPIQSERVSLIQQRKYEGNGLPGGYVPQQRQPQRRREQQETHGQEGGHYAGHRGTSTGGGASSVVLGGGYGPTGSPRMHRKGAREEYVEQMKQQQQPQALYQQHQQYYQQDDYR